MTMKSLFWVIVISVSAVALDNQTGIISRTFGRIPVLKDLILPTINKD